MDRRERYDPEDIESLLSERSFDELLEEERAYVLRHLADREEYETMRTLLLHLRHEERDRMELVPDEAVRTNVVAAFRAQQRPQWSIWLNSIATALWPKEASAFWRPALAFGTVALLIVAGVWFYQRTDEARSSELAEVRQVPGKKAEVPATPPPAAEEKLPNEQVRTQDPESPNVTESVPPTEPVTTDVAQPVTALEDRVTLSSTIVETPPAADVEFAAADKPIAEKALGRENEGDIVSDHYKLEEHQDDAAGTFQPGDAVQHERQDEPRALAEFGQAPAPPVPSATAPASGATSHVVTADELAKNMSTVNVSVESRKFKVHAKDGRVSAQSRSLGSDAGLVSLLNAGW